MWQALIRAGLLGTVLGMMSLPAQAVVTLDEGKLAVSGYAQRIGQSSIPKHPERYRLQGDFTEAGLNLNWRPARRWQVVLDANLKAPRPDKNPIVQFNMLSLKYRLNQWKSGQVSLSAGRMKNTLVGLHSAQESPLLRDGVNISRVYLGNIAYAFSSIEGIQINGEQYFQGVGLLHGQGVYSNQHLVYRKLQNIRLLEDVSFSVDRFNFWGAKLTLEPDALPGWLTGLSYIYTDADNMLEYRGFGQFDFHTESSLIIAMAERQWDQWRLSAEYARLEIHADLAKIRHLHHATHGFYLSLAWQPDSRRLVSLRYGTNDYPRMNGNLMTGSISNKLVSAWIVYGRYRVTPWLYVGVETDWLRAPEQEDVVVLGQLGVNF